MAKRYYTIETIKRLEEQCAALMRENTKLRDDLRAAVDKPKHDPNYHAVPLKRFDRPLRADGGV